MEIQTVLTVTEQYCRQVMGQEYLSLFISPPEVTVPLRGKAAWPAHHVIGQSTFMFNKNTAANFMPKTSSIPLAAGGSRSFLPNKSEGNQKTPEDERSISQRIDDLRAWLDTAQSTSAALIDLKSSLQ